jgi:hypothetical protein
MAHASDNEGVASFEFYVNEQFIVSSVPAESAGVRLGHAEAEFTPAGPGVYQISVVAVNSAGVTGSPATVTVTVSGEAEPVSPEEEPIETEPAVEEEPPAEEAPQEPPPEAPAPSQEVTISFYADPASVQAGSGCATLHWDVKGTEQVYWNGTAVYFRGMEERCNLCEAETHKLQVVKTDGSSEDHWVTINVNGSCSAPAEEPPSSGDVIIPEPIEIDDEGPYIHDYGAEPNRIMQSGISCSSIPYTTTVWAVVHDDSGIGSIHAHWSIGSESGVERMDEGWLGYGATIGPVSTSGKMSVYIVVTDVPGNPSQTSTFPVTVYDTCID